jgi:excisionase family DNA binding protein
MESKVMRTREAAKYLAISPWKLRKLAHEGKVAYISDGDATSALAVPRRRPGRLPGAVQGPCGPGLLAECGIGHVDRPDSAFLLWHGPCTL